MWSQVSFHCFLTEETQEIFSFSWWKDKCIQNHLCWTQRADLTQRVLRTNSPAWHQSHQPVRDRNSLALVPCQWQHNTRCYDSSFRHAGESEFAASTVTDCIMRQLIAPFTSGYNISSGKVRSTFWTSGHLARDSLIYILNGLFIGEHGTNQ